MSENIEKMVLTIVLLDWAIFLATLLFVTKCFRAILNTVEHSARQRRQRIVMRVVEFDADIVLAPMEQLDLDGHGHGHHLCEWDRVQNWNGRGRVRVGIVPDS
ncbi:hypothetical protein BDW74DRAFT_179878 [Aspergillus multicolor]|uniref:uncharacterized protein n=1 Tax=Aspergillus multicolor TaxID=41759 RepID=UPI003CCCEE82